MNYPDGYREMSEEEFLYWERVVELMQDGMSEENAKEKASSELNK